MDIQNLANVSTVVINSLLMLLKDNHVDIESVVMQLSGNHGEALSPEVNLMELAQQTLGELKKASVLEWVDYKLEKPMDGQKCLVIFESKDCEDAQRWMCIDEFNEGMFDFIANWEDQCASVALPAGSVVSKVRAICWTVTNLSNAPLSFDQFYKAQEQSDV